MTRSVDDVKAELTTGRTQKQDKLDPKDLLSCGSTMLNLAVSGRAKGAFYKGKCYHFVGDSDSGKTFITLTAFAEASINKEFDNYRFIHDNPEDGSLMDMSKFFGKSAARRIRPPKGTRAEPIFSQTIEEFYFNLDDALNHEHPCIYVLDSMDAISANQDAAKFQAVKKAKQKKDAGEETKEEKGTYGMAKAKANSVGMREVFNKLKKSKSILIIISQAKTNVGFGFTDKTYSGGLSLKFYAHAQLWSSPIGQIKKKVLNKDRSVGTICLVKVKKNRHTGRKSTAKIPIYWSTGIDDTGSCVDYLLEEKHWVRSGGKINAKEFDVSMNREDLIVHLESNNLQDQLQDIVETVWEEIKEACAPVRKNKYSGDN